MNGARVQSRAIIVILILLSVSAYSVGTSTVAAELDGDYYYTTSGSPLVATITLYNGAGGDITIPSTLGGHPTVSIGDNAFKNAISLTSVTIPNGIKSIGVFSFSGCENLTSVTIPGSVTTIGKMAFFECTSLSSVTIPNGVTSIGTYAFTYCSSLSTATLPSTIATLGTDVFLHCTSLKTINVNEGNPNFASVDGVLYDLKIGTLIKCPEGKEGPLIISSKATSIGREAVRSCYGLTSISIPNSVTSIGTDAFRDCTGLTSITIPSSVTYIEGGAFQSCTALRTVNMLNNGMTFLSNMFVSCTSLDTVNIPSGVQDMMGTFSQCSSLVSITIPNGVTTIRGDALANCPALTAIHFDGDMPTCDTEWMDNHNAALKIYYHEGATGFPSPSWDGVPTIALPRILEPGAPTNFIAAAGDGQVQLSWAAPVDDGGASIDYYVVYQNDRDVAHVTGTSKTITSLTNGVSYSFTVAAHNSAGNGARSEVKRVIPSAPAGGSTHTAPPSSPTNLVVMVQGDAIKLAWEAPDDYGGSTVTAYLVYRGTSASDKSQIATIIETTYTDSDVEMGVLYYYSVAAVNENGSGTPTPTIMATLATPVDEPIGYLPTEYIVAGSLGVVAVAGVVAFIWLRRRPAP